MKSESGTGTSLGEMVGKHSALKYSRNEMTISQFLNEENV